MHSVRRGGSHRRQDAHDDAHRPRSPKRWAIQPPRFDLMGDASYENATCRATARRCGPLLFESFQTTTSYISDDYFALVAEGQGEKPEELLQLGWEDSRFGFGFSHGGGGESGDVHGGGRRGGRCTLVWTPTARAPTGRGATGCCLSRTTRWQQPRRPPVHGKQRGAQQHHSRQPNEYDVVKVYPDAYVQTNTPGVNGTRMPRSKSARVDEGALIVVTSVTAWRRG